MRHSILKFKLCFLFVLSLIFSPFACFADSASSVDEHKTVENLLSKPKSGGYTGVSDIKEENISNFLGFNAISSKYKLYSGFIQMAPGRGYIAIGNDGTAFQIDDIKTFNTFIQTLNLSIKDNKDFVLLTKAYLTIHHSGHTPVILWSMRQTTRDGEVSFREWFLTNPSRSFHAPKTTKLEDHYLVCYYTWSVIAGVLRYESFEVNEKGEILKHKREELTVYYGPYIII